MKLKILKTLLTLFVSFSLFSQNFIEQQLPTPQNLSSFFIGPLIHSTIHYGAKPPNYNGEVLLFNHGYIDLNQLFFTNNTFYEEAYNAGYQVVFVATTRGEGMWVNGKLLAEAIDKICVKYNVNELSIIAHSNGGKAAEVAMYEHQKYQKVKRVFALGTPYWGTYLADISQQWWFNWIWQYTGLNEGSATSTTYYCREVVRPYFDNHSNNEPEKFTIIGGSGFANGHTILAPLMFTSGAILYTQQGTNDGVAPYSSTLRPNSSYLFQKGEAKLDHIDVALGQYVWKYIEPLLTTSPRKINSAKNETYQPASVVSDYQIINSENEYDQLQLDSGNENAVLKVFHAQNKDNFKLKTSNTTLTPIRQKRTDNSSLNEHVSEYVITSKEMTKELSGNGKYIAFLKQPNGVKMYYTSHKNTNKLTVNFSHLPIDDNTLQVGAIITKITTLYGSPVKDEQSTVHSFTHLKGSKNFVLDTSDFTEGTYSIQITGSHTSFKRTLVSGFSIGSLEGKTPEQLIIPNNEYFPLQLRNSLVSDRIEFTSSSSEQLTPEFFVYNLNGQCVKKVSFTKQDTHYNFDLNDTPTGYYIITAKVNQLSSSFKILKR